MSQIPAELSYTAEHEWGRKTGDDTVRVGITDFAQSALGDVVFVQLPDVGAELTSEQPASMARRWSEVVEAPPRAGPDGLFLIDLEGGTLRFRKAGEDGRVGVTGIDVRVVELGRVMREALDRRLERGRNRVRMGGVDFFFR